MPVPVPLPVPAHSRSILRFGKGRAQAEARAQARFLIKDSMVHSKTGTILGGTLLIAGTAIGGGMLALPVLTGKGGFLPASIIFFLCWMCMAATGLLWMEVFLWSKKEVNLISMAQMTLGLSGKVVAWILYLFLFYSLSIAYVSAGGHLVGDLFDAIHFLHTPQWIGPLVFVAIFAPFIIVGAWAVDRLMWVLMTGLILSFILFVGIGFTHIDRSFLLHKHWSLAFAATPVVFTSFGFHATVPTLTQYLGRNPTATKRAILYGSGFALIVYLIWEALILGIVSIGGLNEALQLGQSAVFPLKKIIGKEWLFLVGEFFAFFAIVTSFLGVMLGLFDFLADGLKIKKNRQGKFLLSILLFVPPLLFSLLDPTIFLTALHYAGGLGSALLLALLPILMVWRGRYSLHLTNGYQLGGGRWTLSLLLLFIFAELGVMFAKKI